MILLVSRELFRLFVNMNKIFCFEKEIIMKPDLPEIKPLAICSVDAQCGLLPAVKCWTKAEDLEISLRWLLYNWKAGVNTAPTRDSNAREKECVIKIQICVFIPHRPWAIISHHVVRHKRGTCATHRTCLQPYSFILFYFNLFSNSRWKKASCNCKASLFSLFSKHKLEKGPDSHFFMTKLWA